MKLKLKAQYDHKNPIGTEFEILDIRKAVYFEGGYGLLVEINNERNWLSIEWFYTEGKNKQ